MVGGDGALAFGLVVCRCCVSGHSDFSACGRATQRVGCDGTQDFAQNGIGFSNTSTHDTLTDVRIHGLATNGISGPTGDGVALDDVDILGNASSGWNADGE